MSHQFPSLPYAYDALEPTIDKATMELHYDKHHRAYFNNFMGAAEGTALASKSLEEIFENVSKQAPIVRNNGGGLYNHTLFWNCMSADGGGEPTGELAVAIERDFGSFAAFKEKFAAAASTQFGSGWAWLLVQDGKLAVSGTPNQDNPLMDVATIKGQPILGLDVWEHAYYLNYQNRRPDYISAWWNVVNWDFVAAEYQKAK